ncbi:MAG: hypothetical protein IPG59_14830 [Candidatus Melainabacteria bacterium]|nr:MAG: hypothetical protein IPG59_14830 [Candidatus Melainabacteria bacterium]
MKKLLLALVLLITIQGNVDAKSAPANSKKAASVSKSQALKMVADQPEVKKFMANVKVAGKERGVTANIEYDRLENGEHVIQVFELVPDGDDSAHTATFNWYHVNAKTGKVSKEF